MLFSTASAALVGFSSLSIVSAVPFSFGNNPLGNSFPTPNPSQLLDIEVQAHGALPNGAPPASVSPDTLTSLRLIAFNELFEVAFFTSLLNNVTDATPQDGFHVSNSDERSTIIANLKAIQAQEELHALNANGALAHFNQAPIEACQYNFPTNNLNDAIALASTFTDVVLGTLGDVATLLGQHGDAGLIRGIASVIGQEGEQNGFYRSFLNKIPSALPFLTASARDFAFSALNQNFVVNCDPTNLATIDLNIFGALTVVTPPKAINDGTATFSFNLPVNGTKAEWKSDYSGLELVYINQQNVPVVEKITDAKLQGNTVTFTAPFPFSNNGAIFGNGLTIAAVTTAGKNFTSVDDVAKATIFGPGLIELK